MRTIHSAGNLELPTLPLNGKKTSKMSTFFLWSLILGNEESLKVILVFLREGIDGFVSLAGWQELGSGGAAAGRSACFPRHKQCGKHWRKDVDEKKVMMDNAKISGRTISEFWGCKNHVRDYTVTFRKNTKLVNCVGFMWEIPVDFCAHLCRNMSKPTSKPMSKHFQLLSTNTRVLQ